VRVPRLTLVCASLVVGLAWAASPSNNSVIRFSYGMTKIDLTGKGLPGVVVFSRRDNFNAHGFDVLSIYVATTGLPEAHADFLIVPFFTDGKEQLELTSGGGADCRLHDTRLIHGPDGIHLILAQRAPGQSFVDRELVTFAYFDLKHNSTGEIGRPLYYFERTRSSTSEQKYCDVGEAFKQELGMDSYREPVS